jgi:putative oxidoreductase
MYAAPAGLLARITTLKGGAVRILEKLKPLALLWLRVGLGVIFFYHGYTKLFVTQANSLQVFPKMGFPSYFVYIAGILELFGAILLLAGLFTRVTALLLALEMAVVLVKVSIPQRGIYSVTSYEVVLMLCSGSLALAAVGAGLFSLDAVTFERAGVSRPKIRR